MGKIQIVIEISEEMYQTVKDETYCGSLYEELKNGTPLPKNHGDLIDRNELLDCSYEISSMYCLYDLVVSVDDVKDAPTIIEEVKADDT